MRLWLFEHPLAHQAIHWLVATWWVRSPFLTTKLRLVSQHQRGPHFCRTLGECVLFMLVTLTGTKIDSVNCDLYWKYKLIWGFPGSASGKKKKRKTNPPANKGDTRDMCSTPGLRRYPEGGNGNPLQYSCLESLVDRRVRWVTVQRVIKNWALLKGLSMHACINLYEVCNMAVFWFGMVVCILVGIQIVCVIDPWVRKNPWRREWLPTPVFLPGESHGQVKPGSLQSMGFQRVGHNWATNTFTFHFRLV